MMMGTVSRMRMRITMGMASQTRVGYNDNVSMFCQNNQSCLTLQTTLMMMVMVSWMVRRMMMVTVLSTPRMLMTTMTVGLRYFKV